MSIPESAIGAIVAAFIGSLFAYLGLVISKESKISEFRQAWIDSFRTELAEVIAAANQIRGLRAAEFESLPDLYKALDPHFLAYNTASTSITLRLNLDEKPCQEIHAAMQQLDLLIVDFASGKRTDAEVDLCEQELVSAVRPFLKVQWNRVRRGEPVFVASKWAACASVVFLASWAVWTWLGESVPAAVQKLLHQITC